MTGGAKGSGLWLTAMTPPCHCEAWFKNVVAQFIGQLCLMNQATTKCGGEATWTDTLQGNPKLEALNPKQIQISKFKTFSL